MSDQPTTAWWSHETSETGTTTKYCRFQVPIVRSIAQNIRTELE